MKPARPDTTSSTAAADAAVPHRRGKSKAKNFSYDGPKAVICLELDLTDTGMRRRVEKHYEAVFRLRRALQREVQVRCRAYWADPLGRAESPKQVRERLGLSRKGIEALAKQHVEDSEWMRHHLLKATALHVADQVWETVDRHLFADSSGNRHGAPRVGSWWDFARVPGRARSHTKKAQAWETYRLAGTLQGHLDQYRPAELDDLTVAEAVLLPAGTSVLAQPQALPAPARPDGRSGWWDHQGALTVVFTGLPKGDLILPVRLPQGAGQWPHLAHYLADESRWHKIDLVRVQDRHAPGGWRYYAHLLIHGPGYQSESTRSRRALVPPDRTAGLDANVSNISVLSHTNGTDVQTSTVTVTPEMLAAASRDAAKARRRQKALDRSRRNNNADQYELSKRQAKSAARRAAAGLPAKTAPPGGARVSRKDGKPKRAYRKDELSGAYRRLRADHASDKRRVSQAKHARAATVAADLTVQHGNQWIAEQVAVSNWAHLWGERIAIFSPGMLQAAIRQEAAATGGAWSPAATRTTAMSQHCLCGQRVSKTLSQRTHTCGECGLTQPRDLVSAALASAVSLTDPTDPATTRVDYELAQRISVELETTAQQEERVESTGPQPSHTRCGDGQDRQPPPVAAAQQPQPHTGLPRHSPPASPDQSEKTEPLPVLVDA